MKNKLILIAYILIFLPSEILAIENKVLFKINNEIITSIDVWKETKYLNLLNEDLKKLNDKEIFKIAENLIIKKKIREIELKKYYKKLELENKFVEKFMLDYFKELKFSSLKELDDFLKKNSLDLNDIKEKITIQIMWNQLIFKKFSQKIKIDKKLIKDEISTKEKQEEFLINEIVFDVKDKNNLDEKYNLILNEVKNNNFSKAALLYSISETSLNGGNIGWVKLNSLSKQIRTALKNTSIGEITKPIKIPGAFIILNVKDKRETLIKLDINNEVEKIVKRKTNEQLNQFSNIYFNKIKKDVSINEL